MPITLKRGSKGTKPVPHRGWTQGCAITLGLENYEGQKVPGFRFDGSGRSFQTASVEGMKVNPDGTKIGGDWFSDPNSTCRKHGSRSNARKAASAMIAKIPYDLSAHIAQVYYPKTKGT